MKNLSILFMLVLTVTCCTPEKTPIEYGLDKCHYCRMTIVDKRFGCELVTSKGKVYKFDATECMAHYMEQENLNAEGVALVLTNTWDRPGELISVESCLFLQSENMPSPMGEFINPFADGDSAIKQREAHSGNIYKWEDLKAKLREETGPM